MAWWWYMGPLWLGWWHMGSLGCRGGNGAVVMAYGAMGVLWWLGWWQWGHVVRVVAMGPW